MGTRLVVIGGDGAAMSAAVQARRRNGDLEVVALERGERTSYSACGIPAFVAGEVGRVSELVARSPEQYRAMRIDARTGHEVTAIDLERRTVEVHNPARERSFTLGFDLLHIATGARAPRPAVPGVDRPHVHAVRTLADAAALAEDLRVRRPETAVVVGSGYVGLEMAEALVARGLAVTVVERGPSAMASLDPDMGDLVAAAMRRAGITVHLDEHLVGIDDGAVTTSGGERPADLVVLGTGIEPDTSLAAGAGLALGVRDSIVVDRRQRTSAPGVYAAGDCAQSHHVVTGGPTWVALGTVANKQGRVAGINLAGGYATFPGVVGTAVTRVCAAEVGRTGLGAAEAEAAGFVVDTATVTGTTTAAYLPSAEALTLKLVAERGSGRVLGMQVVGGAGSAKRVDAVAVALHAGMDVTDLIDLDLAYAPMFSPVWEPVQIAARELAGRAG